MAKLTQLPPWEFPNPPRTIDPRVERSRRIESLAAGLAVMLVAGIPLLWFGLKPCATAAVPAILLFATGYLVHFRTSFWIRRWRWRGT